MIITASAKDWKAALATVASSVGTQTTLPIVTFVHISTSDESVRLRATDLSSTIEYTFEPDSVERDGAICLPFTLLRSIIQAIPAEQAVTLRVNREPDAIIEAGDFEAGLKGRSADDFPAAPHTDDGMQETITASDLRRIIRKTEYAAAKDESRPVLRAIVISTTEGGFEVAAADGFRLAVYAHDGRTSDDEAVIKVPHYHMARLEKMLPRGDEPITMTANQAQVKFAWSGISYTSQQISGSFPNYGQLIPNDDGNVITVNRAVFRDAVKACSVMANNDTGTVRLQLNENRLDLSARADDIGEAKYSLACNVKGDTFVEAKIAFNSAYLLQVLDAMDSDEMTMQIDSPSSPAKFTEDGYIAVLMPMFVQW